MQLGFLSALVLFLGSYFPLSIIFFVQSIKEQYWDESFCWPLNKFLSMLGCHLPEIINPTRVYGFMAITAVSLICVVLFLKMFKKGKEKIEVLETKLIPNEIINYSLPYVVSFMGLSPTENGKFIGFIVFLSIMFWLTYMSGQILLNPALIAFGWKIYELTGNLGNTRVTVHALSRDEINRKDKKSVHLIQNIYVVTKE